MKLSTSFVAIRKIKPSASRWNFSDDEINKVAHLMVEVEGMINPLILRPQEGTESYEVLDGNFEYYAAARASEMAPNGFEMIAAFIINPEDEKNIQEQIKMLRNWNAKAYHANPQTDPASSASDVNDRLRHLESRQATLESRQTILETQEIRQLEQQLTELNAQIHKKIDLLTAFNELDRSKLLSLMRRVGLAGKTAEKIVETIEQERQYKQFVSLRDVVTRVKGLTYEKMVDLLEDW